MEGGFYRQELPRSLQRKYDAVLRALVAQRKRIPVGNMQMTQYWKVEKAIRRDAPEIFFLKSSAFAYYPVTRRCEIEPQYRFAAPACAAIRSAMEARTAPFLGAVRALPERERAREIHDLLARKTTYRDPEAPYSHEAPGPLLYGIGVCEGIAKAFKFLADRAGLPCLVVYGRYAHSGTGHAWNLVRVDGAFFHVDATYDLTPPEEPQIRRAYFLRTEAEILRTHIPDDDFALPRAPGPENFCSPLYRSARI